MPDLQLRLGLCLQFRLRMLDPEFYFIAALTNPSWLGATHCSKLDIYPWDVQEVLVVPQLWVLGLIIFVYARILLPGLWTINNYIMSVKGVLQGIQNLFFAFCRVPYRNILHA